MSLQETPHDAPVRTWGGITRSVAEVREFFGSNAPDTILHRYGVWCVTTFGVECLSHPYSIEWARVWEMDWVDHLCRKNWVNRDDVVRVFEVARAMPQALRTKPASWQGEAVA